MNRTARTAPRAVPRALHRFVAFNRQQIALQERLLFGSPDERPGRRR